MLKVVIVEDEDLVRRGIVLAVDWNSMDCVVVGEAQNGEEGLEVIRRHSPDLVITDVKMPRMDGVEMIRRLKEEGCQAAFVILTAHSDFAFAHSALRLGVSDYLLKPFQDRELVEAVNTVREKLLPPPSPPGGELLRPNLEKGAKSKYVEEAIRYITQHYPEDLTVGRVAQHLGLSEGYLSRVFKKETDDTFMSYLTNYRIRAAMELLRDPCLKIYEVADQVGYTDNAYFSTLFKKTVGVTPSEYQDRCR